MGRKSKLEKIQRDQAVLSGLPALFAGAASILLFGARHTTASLARPFEEHLRALEQVDVATRALRRAVQKERKLDAITSKLAAQVKDKARVAAGGESPGMRAYGFEPDRPKVMSAETKRRANDKRQATRKKRGLTSKKKRAAG